MKILKIDHSDFVFEVHSASFDESFSKAKRKQTDMKSATRYRITPGAAKLFCPFSNSFISIDNGSFHPVFFENKDYVFGIEFKEKHSISEPYVFSKLKDVRDKFFYNERIGYLSGTLNFGNDLGSTDFIVRYLKRNKQFEIRLSFEVFPTKLDYRNDYTKIISEIETEYPLLVLDFLRKTYSGFKSGSTENTDLIWWQVFGGLFEEFIIASNFILNKPHSRLIQETVYVKADKLKRVTPAIEEEFHRFRSRPEKNYRTQHKLLSVDTPENRFFKHALSRTFYRFQNIKKYIRSKYTNSISPDYTEELNRVDTQLKKCNANPIFRTIGRFAGMRQESLVLERATGYSSIYKVWIMLNAGISFFEGVSKMELKNIAELYQVWCFLTIKNMLQDVLGKTSPDEIKLAKFYQDDFVFKIDRGMKSRIAYNLDDGRKVQLYHDLQFDTKGTDSIRAFTVNQRPDIVLQLTKNDLKDNYVLTYLYDAKYRLRSDDDSNAADLPPDDAINQMHRYRDAIYYHNKSQNQPEKEVIGGYVLFPGTGSIDQIRESMFYTSIKDVNIGAFPLCPNNEYNSILLQNHLNYLISTGSEVLLGSVRPHKKMTYEEINPDVLVGFVKKGIQTDYFIDEKAEPEVYHSGPDTPSKIGYSKIKYFVPYISGMGYREYYEVVEMYMQKRNLIFPKGHMLFNPDDQTQRLVIKLGKKYIIKNGEFNTLNTLAIYRYTKLNHVKSASISQKDDENQHDLNQ